MFDRYLMSNSGCVKGKNKPHSNSNRLYHIKEKAGNKYINVFQRALDSYVKIGEREGCPKSFFTSFLHGFTKNPGISKLEQALFKANDYREAKCLIMDRLRSKTFNAYSFNSYLVDELTKEFPEENWAQFNPKKISYYKGEVFRGVRDLDPAIIFKNGLYQKMSANSFETYLSPFNASIGNSCSKLFYVGMTYACPNFEDKIMYRNGYVYMIDYQGNKGFDLVKTHLDRSFSLSRVFLPNYEEEINIAENIENTAVICAFKITKYNRVIDSVYINDEITLTNHHINQIRELLKQYSSREVLENFEQQVMDHKGEITVVNKKSY